ncbi:molybdopterin-dependent oxidoreductase [Mucilaginibacter myungsuensis]|uniref:Molybdopterin-dependent oxidoreductase n=1 Tax=Mucilaginibacter myungsuensis TaxID=649104 RepID=A0A929L0V5_9SPHI|nr:molybdopterin-dependent oxidoreductase [Mucilaginibacter myungsuensis]MBE9663518.1 molybdopterin-dependent oxidoreductase [Mucilaginibacter myungsuensis]MDN3600256.1 molybdopterin-dependent oxidoreductase [Mucilaginibacter myungsuensis]
MKQLLTTIIICFIAITALAQSIKISGEVAAPTELKLADMAQYPQTEVSRKDRDGKDHKYTGVLLSTILQKAGATLGKDLKGENLTKYITVEASDGYQVLFALAELDKDFTDRQIILATKIDGQPLALADGPFRIIVEGEKKPARCIKQVTAIKVAFAK